MGGDNASKAAGLDEALKMAEQSSARIYTIGIFEPEDPDWNPKVLQRLAQETGGEAIFPTRLSETVEICERISSDQVPQVLAAFGQRVQSPNVMGSEFLLAQTPYSDNSTVGPAGEAISHRHLARRDAAEAAGGRSAHSRPLVRIPGQMEDF